MTIKFGETVFFGAGHFFRIGAAIMFVAIAGCSSTNTGGPVPMATDAGPKDTGTFPNLNIPPQVAAKQFTEAEKNAKLAQLKADENAQRAKRGGAAVTNQAALTDLAKKHGPQTLTQIEGKCDPALDPTCK
ncbi:MULTISPECIES: hypothetical protein [unclassified Mesorhizobium]|uniref:hypothetical protein n=1 Tax=unclassified Mesorhizobium TaxID=325217 RepID=UPI000FCB8B4A|nr:MULTISPECIES: hypothetical protein [unclassified Mesorhizobium]RUW87248.1 hypothetical protein EOA30_36620 [Mesorhizobium sp. M8A.F.Ca.ET.059.01.1.1]RVD47290.1 hypothetical protein EN746_27245 [Mesorhizobium sp. M8A.F.Ca.ET.023.02.2.1]TGR38913.1 hypothetical protein EN842_43125 [bacterium M00.F.Ca.ET.199.01.1.1]TGU27525.1 hypothetical protein EN799_41060 [bacterium M00.F.Ca.ET.156.01.1.1]TGV83949.1 hypothetical protein EN792_023450 [Mesorhizobium sp. M00.F.Ca.ET.149.01.1.1]